MSILVKTGNDIISGIVGSSLREEVDLIDAYRDLGNVHWWQIGAAISGVFGFAGTVILRVPEIPDPRRLFR